MSVANLFRFWQAHTRAELAASRIPVQDDTQQPINTILQQMIDEGLIDAYASFTISLTDHEEEEEEETEEFGTEEWPDTDDGY